MFSRRSLVGLMVVAVLVLTGGCATQTEEPAWQQIEAPDASEQAETPEEEPAREESPEAAQPEAESPETDREETPTDESETTETPESPSGDEPMQTAQADAAPAAGEMEEPEADRQDEAAQPPPTGEPSRRSMTKEWSRITASQAIAIVLPVRGSTVRGWVNFREVDEGVNVRARFAGLNPNQKYGFHIHEFGDAADRDKGMSVGGHYDPQNTGHHARPNANEPHHAGDLGNLESNDEGAAAYDRTITNISVTGGPNPVLGRAVVVHAKPDDFGQPTGNAGPRIAVGVIGVNNPNHP